MENVMPAGASYQVRKQHSTNELEGQLQDMTNGLRTIKVSNVNNLEKKLDKIKSSTPTNNENNKNNNNNVDENHNSGNIESTRTDSAEVDRSQENSSGKLTDAGMDPNFYYNSEGEGHSVRIEVDIPNDKVGLIIGRGGATIKALSRQTKAKLYIPDYHDNKDRYTRTITITAGNKYNAELAKVAVEQIAKGNKTYLQQMSPYASNGSNGGYAYNNSNNMMNMNYYQLPAPMMNGFTPAGAYYNQPPSNPQFSPQLHSTQSNFYPPPMNYDLMMSQQFHQQQLQYNQHHQQQHFPHQMPMGSYPPNVMHPQMMMMMPPQMQQDPELQETQAATANPNTDEGASSEANED